MKILNNLVQGSEEWFEERAGKLSSSRVKGVLFNKVINKTDIVNYLLGEFEKDLRQTYESNIGLTEIEEKDIKKLMSTYKKELDKLSQRELESKLPIEMYEEAFTKTQKKEYYRLLAEQLGYKDDELEDPRDRGHRLEDEAAEAVGVELGISDRIKVIGFVTREDYPDIALSPDRFITKEGYTIDLDINENITNIEDVVFEGGIEIKSPGVVNHLEIWKTNKVPSEYWDQVIQYFVVGDTLEYVLFASYNPIVKECPLVIIRVNRKDVLQDIKESLDCQVNIINHIKRDIETLTF